MTKFKCESLGAAQKAIEILSERCRSAHESHRRFTMHLLSKRIEILQLQIENEFNNIVNES